MSAAVCSVQCSICVTSDIHYEYIECISFIHTKHKMLIWNVADLKQYNKLVNSCYRYMYS